MQFIPRRQYFSLPLITFTLQPSPIVSSGLDRIGHFCDGEVGLLAVGQTNRRMHEGYSH